MFFSVNRGRSVAACQAVGEPRQGYSMIFVSPCCINASATLAELDPSNIREARAAMSRMIGRRRPCAAKL